MKVCHILTISLILFLFNTTNAQETWFFELNDGKVIKGTLPINGFWSGAKKIGIKDKKTNKKEKIEAIHLAKLTSVIEGDTAVYTKMKQGYNRKRKVKYYDGLFWATKLYGSDKIEAYITIEKSLSTGSTAGGPTTATVGFYAALNFRVVSEDYLFLVGPYRPDEKSSRKVESRLMVDALKSNLADTCPSFAAGLHKRSYLLYEYEKIIDDYTAKCK